MKPMFLPGVENDPQPGAYPDHIFFNRWVDAAGVHALSDEAHRQGGKRSADAGYVKK